MSLKYEKRAGIGRVFEKDDYDGKLLQMVYYLDCGKHRSYRQVLIELESNLTTTRQYCVHLSLLLFVYPVFSYLYHSPQSFSSCCIRNHFLVFFFFFPLKVIKRLFCRKVLTLMKKKEEKNRKTK